MKSLAVAFALTAAVASPAAALTVANPTPIIVVDGGETTSTINVSGVSGPLSNLSVTLSGLSHTYPDDLVFGLLNESLGFGFVFMSGSGGSTDISGVTLNFSDFASGQLPESFVGGQIVSGTYLPSNYGQYEFTFFANATSFSDFNGIDPNGNWTLYVDDIFPADGGSLSGGWSISFDTRAVPEPASWALMIGGFALVGAAMRRRTSHVAFAV